jgi:hypothetical protein
MRKVIKGSWVIATVVAGVLSGAAAGRSYDEVLAEGGGEQPKKPLIVLAEGGGEQPKKPLIALAEGGGEQAKKPLIVSA